MRACARLLSKKCACAARAMYIESNFVQYKNITHLFCFILVGFKLNRNFNKCSKCLHFIRTEINLYDQQTICPMTKMWKKSILRINTYYSDFSEVSRHHKLFCLY